MHKLLTENEAADILGLHPDTLNGWRCRKKGPPFIRLGRGPKAAIRYQLHELEAWINENRVVPNPRGQAQRALASRTIGNRGTLSATQ